MNRLIQSICFILCLLVCREFEAQSDQVEVAYTLFLIGDAGEPVRDGTDPVFADLKSELSRLSGEGVVVFLGDNIYPDGLPNPDHFPEAYNIAISKLNVQLDAVRDFEGDVYFLAGNHDWNKGHPGGLERILRQEEYIEEYLDKGNVFLPNAGCPGPITKKLGKDANLVFIDSQWFLHPLDQEDTEDLDCEVNTVFKFQKKLREILDDNDDEHVVLLMHHPIFTYGEHGGHYTLKDHLFPLSNIVKGLYIPLPGIGSLYPFYRSTFGHVQDLPNPVNKDFQEIILNTLYEKRNVILAAGHEHNMQHIFHHDNHFVVSGSGSKTTSVRQGKNSLFAESKKGYARLIFKSDGTVWLEFHATGEGTIYSSQLKEKEYQVPQNVAQYTLRDNQVTLAASDRYASGSLHKFFFGEHYREEWSTPVTVRAINLSTERGGLKPIKKGGGFASLSLRLEDENEDQFVLRSVDKNIFKVVPEQFRNTVAQTIIQDQIAASHPYGALAVPELAHAADVYHTSPEIVYLPKQDALGDYNADFGKGLYLYEERPAGNLKENDHFGNSKKIVSFTEVLDEITDNSDARVNQRQVLRSRLFDIFLGDWDRHDDQWRWARFEEEDPFEKKDKIRVFEPIPRDRDQVFYIYKGLIPWIVRQTPALKKFQSFDHDIGNVVALNFNARHFDRSFLTAMDRQDWLDMAGELKENLTDQAIEKAIGDLPPEIYLKGGEEIVAKLKSRREKLDEFAVDYYDFLSDYVDVVGTDKSEYFEIIRRTDQTTLVRVYKYTKNEEKEDLMYERVFHPQETREIRLYGLKDDDVFEISGKQNKGILLRIIGGKGDDRLTDHSSVRGSKRKTIVYDSSNGMDLDAGEEVRDKRSSNDVENRYDRLEYYYPTNFFIPFVAFNGDDGLLLSALYTGTRYGFRKTPYKSKFGFRLGYAASKNEFSGNFGLEYLDVFGKADFRLDAQFFLPNDVNNFFGLGNETIYDQSLDIDFYRYDQFAITINPSIQFKSKRDFHQIHVGPFYGYRKLGSSQEGFIADFDRNGLSDEDFEGDYLTGIKFEYVMQKLDNPVNPGKGIRFKFDPAYIVNLSDEDANYTRLSGSLTLYNFIGLPKPFVYAAKIQGAVNFGDYQFYQANYLGIDQGLRAYRNNRFGGKSSFVFSNDLRIRLFESKNFVMPFQFGITASYDYGRVWNRDDSGVWHDAYGGGIWFSPYNASVISIAYMTSSEDANLLALNFGFSF